MVKSSMDIKAGFTNVRVPKDLQKYLGLVTQDGLYVYQRMPFGINAAPAHFQFVMHQVLNRGADPPKHSTYVDDCHTGGKDVKEAWHNTMKALRRLAGAGFPISVRKCHFLHRMLPMLGVLLASSKYILGCKSIAKLFG